MKKTLIFTSLGFLIFVYIILRWINIYISSINLDVDKTSLLVATIALIISVATFLFTVVKWWWENWGRVKLIVGIPQTFAACAHKGNFINVELPLVFYNSGPSSYIVNNLRLILSINDTSEILDFTYTKTKLGEIKEEQTWATQFPVEGRRIYSYNFGFLKSHSNFSFVSPKCDALLEAKLNQESNWSTILKFELYTPEDKLRTLNSNTFIVYSNDKG